MITPEEFSEHFKIHRAPRTSKLVRSPETGRRNAPGRAAHAQLSEAAVFSSTLLVFDATANSKP